MTIVGHFTIENRNVVSFLTKLLYIRKTFVKLILNQNSLAILEWLIDVEVQVQAAAVGYASLASDQVKQTQFSVQINLCRNAAL